MTFDFKEEVVIKGLGTMCLASGGSFYDTNDGLNVNGSPIAYARDVDIFRMRLSKDHSLSQCGSRIREGALFDPDAHRKGSENRRILLRDSIILATPETLAEAVACHKRGEEYAPKDLDIEEFLHGLVEDKDYCFAIHFEPVDTEKLHESREMSFIHQDKVKSYGKWLHKNGIATTQLTKGREDHYIDSQPKPFADQLSLHGLGINSNIVGNVRSLNYDRTVRGVRYEISGEASASKKKFIQTYTRKQMESYVIKSLHKAGIYDNLEKKIIDNLPK
jgi:hypothetical protein